MEEGVTSMIQSKPSTAVSELTINSIDGYESKYTRNIPQIENTQVIEENECMPNFIHLSRYEGKLKIVIPLDANIHVPLHDTSGNLSCGKGPSLISQRPGPLLEHREKAYEVLGTTESMYNAYNVNEEDEHKTATTTQLTESLLDDELQMIMEAINHDRNHIKPHFQDEPEPIHYYFCMRFAFLWRYVSRCCSWFLCIYVVICII